MALLDSKQLNPSLTGSFILSGSTQTFIGASEFQGSITASGDISASGVVIADTFQSTGGDVDGISFTDDLNLSGNFTASGDISGSGNIFGTGNLDIDGTSNLEGDVTLQNDLSVTGNITGSNFSGSYVSTGSFGKLSVQGIIQGPVDNHLDIKSDRNIKLHLDNDNDSASSKFTVFDGGGSVRFQVQEDGKTSIGGDVDATSNFVKILSGNVTASSNVSASGNLSATGNLDIDGTSNLASDLFVGGNITGSNDISASGNIYGTGNLDIDGTSNFAGNVTMQNDLVVTGRIDAEEIHTTFISSSVAQATGSNIFGDTTTDSHQFTGSVDISGSLRVSDGNVVVSDTLTATNIGAFTAAGAIDFDSQNMTNVDIDSGTINGITDLAVADGGTGVSTLTDGGVLLGSGTSAITAMAVLTDGQMIVGDGSTDPVAESGATLRTSIGVGTTDDVKFANITGSGNISGSYLGTGSFGRLEVVGNTNIDGDITLGGDITIGDASGDSISFEAEISSSLIPDADSTYDIGSSSKNWRFGYIEQLSATHITASANISASGNLSVTGNLDIDGTANIAGDTTFQSNVTASGNVSGSQSSSGSFGYLSVDGIDISSLGTSDLSAFSSSIATQLNTLSADVIALSIALG